VPGPMFCAQPVNSQMWVPSMKTLSPILELAFVTRPAHIQLVLLQVIAWLGLLLFSFRVRFHDNLSPEIKKMLMYTRVFVHMWAVQNNCSLESKMFDSRSIYYLSIYLSSIIYLSIIYPSIYLSIYPSIHLSTYLAPIYLSICLSSKSQVLFYFEPITEQSQVKDSDFRRQVGETEHQTLTDIQGSWRKTKPNGDLGS
jgi:hypothetical protein